MAFKQKRDFGHYSEIRQGILKKIKNVYDDDFNENIVKIFISHSSKNKHDAKNIKNILRDFFPCIEVFVLHCPSFIVQYIGYFLQLWCS